jgi:hypothetical protein
LIQQSCAVFGGLSISVRVGVLSVLFRVLVMREREREGEAQTVNRTASETDNVHG